MSQNSWITSTNLLFRPTVIEKKVTEVISDHLKKGDDPLFAIAYAIDQIMEAHTKRNLEPILDALKIAHQTTYTDLFMLRLGYRFITSSILIMITCKDKTDIQRVATANSFMEESTDADIQRVQNEILNNLRSTINLYKFDDSGALIFQFLTDYPAIDHQYFKAGMEMAIIMISGFSQIITKNHPNLHWPSPTTDFTIVT